MIPSLIWNYRGLGNPKTQSYVARFINKHHLCLIGLTKPMTPSTHIQPFLMRFGIDHFHSNPTNHIWLFWSRAFTLRVLDEGPQHITVMVQDPLLEFAFTIIYASYRPLQRESLWEDFVTITKDYPTLVKAPWFLAGDFNCIRRVNESQGGRIPRARNMETFNDFIFRAALIEPPTLGETWTWCNERQAWARIYECIDRCFTNIIAMVQSPISITVLTHYRPDHAPLLFLPYKRLDTPRPPFRFQTMWLQPEGFFPFVWCH